MLDICLLVSGGLGRIILDDILKSKYHLTAVLTNKSSKDIQNACLKNDIPCFVGNPRGGKTKDFLSSLRCDILLSVNYLFIVESDLINFPEKYAINIHGSLLPKYRGRTPHVWAIINGEKEVGITAHLIDEDVDNGDIVKQKKIQISDTTTGGEIVEMYKEFYPEIVKELLNDIIENNLNTRPQDLKKATYFGKRTPDLGLIDWSWGRERIRNWIRAQAKPYPGAFTYFNGNKIISHKSRVSNYGFHYSTENGTILRIEEEGLIVKTPTGAIELTDLDYNRNINLSIGDVLQ